MRREKYRKRMIKIDVQNQEVSPGRLEALKQELCKIGVNSFAVDCLTNHITLIRHCPLKECDIRCALEKAGFQDLCLRFCSSKD